MAASRSAGWTALFSACGRARDIGFSTDGAVDAALLACALTAQPQRSPMSTTVSGACCRPEMSHATSRTEQKVATS